MSDQKNGNNVVKFNKDRKSPSATKRSGANGRGPSGSGRGDGYERALRGQKGSTGIRATGVKWFHYVQVILLLALVAWLMKSCQI